MNKIFIINSYELWGRWLRAHFEFATHLILIVYFISYKKVCSKLKVHAKGKLVLLIDLSMQSIIVKVLQYTPTSM